MPKPNEAAGNLTVFLTQTRNFRRFIHELNEK